MHNSDFLSVLEKEQSNISTVTTFQSDDLIEKLKLLNYEKHLLKEMKMKALTKFYFVKSFNPGEQFFMFTSVCAWLLRKLGKHLDQPQEHEDPNEIINKILKILQEIDIVVDVPTNKLLQGAGPICLYILDSLATQAVKVSQIFFKHHHIKQEIELAPEFLEDNAEIILEKLDDEQNTAFSDDSDNGGNSLKDLNWFSSQNAQKRTNNDLNYNGDNFTEHEIWRLELERVLPQLKIVVKADSRDWRSHLSQIENLKQNIDGISDETQMQLKKLHSEFTFNLDKVESREKHLNNELSALIKQFKDVSIELAGIQFASKQISQDTEKTTTELITIVQENENKKTKMEQRGQLMSDGSSVVHIKKAIQKLKEDISHLNLEIGLLLHAYDHDIIRQSSIFSAS
ncbi:intraflagellar transport protein 57 homolog [Episyrphus balteatus]|uniref:intraflagellar transport protein 57 homolog n=1 Tax=Episyrphus balteatus TaxID=286459 RepID=UPI0024859B4C|nr:intraflagellar transport protein 57 homolog [Episyrphus balteatus]